MKHPETTAAIHLLEDETETGRFPTL